MNVRYGAVVHRPRPGQPALTRHVPKLLWADLLRYRLAKSPLISWTPRNFAISRLPLRRRLVRYRLHMWQIGMSKGGVVLTVTSDDLDLLLWAWQTFKGQFLKGKISETIADTSTLLCTQLDMILQGAPNYDLDLRKKRSKRLDLLIAFPVPVCRRLDVERTSCLLGGWQMWGSRRRLWFLVDLGLLVRLWYIFT